MRFFARIRDRDLAKLKRGDSFSVLAKLSELVIADDKGDVHVFDLVSVSQLPGRTLRIVFERKPKLDSFRVSNPVLRAKGDIEEGDAVVRNKDGSVSAYYHKNGHKVTKPNWGHVSVNDKSLLFRKVAPGWTKNDLGRATTLDKDVLKVNRGCKCGFLTRLRCLFGGHHDRRS